MFIELILTLIAKLFQQFDILVVYQKKIIKFKKVDTCPIYIYPIANYDGAVCDKLY